MAMASILVADQDQDERSRLRAVLEAEGWNICESASKDDLFACLATKKIDLITLNPYLGRKNDLEFVRELRATKNIPVVVITDQTDPIDRVRGLEMGADDLVTKPFDGREVVLRVRRVLERYGWSEADTGTVLFDHSSLDLRRHVVKHLDGSPISLTAMELQMLELFVGRPGRILSRDEISQALYGRDWSPMDRTIDGHVARLRRKIEPADGTLTLIRAVRGVGYVFTGEVNQATAAVE